MISAIGAKNSDSAKNILVKTTVSPVLPPASTPARFIPADVSVKDGRFYYIDRKRDTDFQAEAVLDADGKYMIPGLKQ